MPTQSYKGFTITGRPYQLHATRQWAIDLEISRRGRHRSFSAQDHAATEAEALAACLEFGRRIIDGQVPGCSVAALQRR